MQKVTSKLRRAASFLKRLRGSQLGRKGSTNEHNKNIPCEFDGKESPSGKSDRDFRCHKDRLALQIGSDVVSYSTRHLPGDSAYGSLRCLEADRDIA